MKPLESVVVEKWPLGVFASFDAGLGVRPDVASRLGIRTVHLHSPRPESGGLDRAREIASRLGDLGITVTCVFGGFEGESYADIPTVRETVGLVPAATRPARMRNIVKIADFARPRRPILPRPGPARMQAGLSSRGVGADHTPRAAGLF